MLATSSRTHTSPLGWLRQMVQAWAWRLLFPTEAAVQPAALPPKEVRHLQNLSQRRYPIPQSRAHLYARSVD